MLGNYHEIENSLRAAIALSGNESFDGDLDYKEPPFSFIAEAAILILVNVYKTPSVLLTTRSKQLRKHPGQVAFPGGRKDEIDATLLQTALREASEEIGLPINHPLIHLGQLPDHKTISKFKVTPFIAINKIEFEYKLAANEVETIFEVPLKNITPSNFYIDQHEFMGSQRRFFVFRHETFYIWGATARILHNLARRLHNVCAI